MSAQNTGFLEWVGQQLGVTYLEAQGMEKSVRLIRAIREDEDLSRGLGTWAVLRHRARLSELVHANKKALWSGLGVANEARQMLSVLASFEEQWRSLESAYYETGAPEE